MQRVCLESGAALVICSGIQSGEFSQAFGFSEENKTLGTSQPPREIYQNRSEDCQAQQIHHVSDGVGCDR